MKFCSEVAFDPREIVLGGGPHGVRARGGAMLHMKFERLQYENCCRDQNEIWQPGWP